MAATSLTFHSKVPSADSDAKKYAKNATFIVRRNMKDWRSIENPKANVPERTVSNPSPLKKAASNRHPGQTHTRDEIDDALCHELARGQVLMHDLADHTFGRIVSTKLATAILRHFVQDMVVQVQVVDDASKNKTGSRPLNAESDAAHTAVQEAFGDACQYQCTRTNAGSAAIAPGPSSTSSTKGEGKQKSKTKTHSFTWNTFPAEPLKEDELVLFLNKITDLAFNVAKSRLPETHRELRYRFAAPMDKHHAVPLSYEPDCEDMRPDFLLLPIKAVPDIGDPKKVDPTYINFTATRLVGEAKNKNALAGVEQLQRYARGVRRAQPWVHLVLGLTVTKDKAVFVRGDGSGTERLVMTLTDGRGCIEFIRVLLGLALADEKVFGHHPHVVLKEKLQTCKARNITRRSNRSTAQTMSRRSGNDSVFSAPDPVSRLILSEPQPVAPTQSGSISIRQNGTASSSKRGHSEVADDGEERIRSKKRKTEGSTVDLTVVYPGTVFGFECLGVVFTGSSLRGRLPVVYSVKDEKSNRLVVKTSWQDVTRIPDQDAVIDRLEKQGSHPNVIAPLMYEVQKITEDGKMYTTLGTLREFLADDIARLGVEDRVFTKAVFQLKRPVKYFWGVHDFVRGLRGALLGHEYLASIGILHRDISENNIVLALRPEEERGYLIDLDMAILQHSEEPSKPTPVMPFVWPPCSAPESSAAPETDNKKPMKALRTGTFPYMSYNVLLGGRHAQFDDVESFLYVLLLFFFSYAGPLPVAQLRQADEDGFAQSVGSGRPSHMRNWSPTYAFWADGPTRDIALRKQFAITNVVGLMEITESSQFLHCLENNWPKELHASITFLIGRSFTLFYNSVLRTAGKASRTEVSHAEFIEVLDLWLKKYSDLEDKYSNCPFKEHKDISETAS